MMHKIFSKIFIKSFRDRSLQALTINIIRQFLFALRANCQPIRNEPTVSGNQGHGLSFMQYFLHWLFFCFFLNFCHLWWGWGLGVRVMVCSWWGLGPIVCRPGRANRCWEGILGQPVIGHKLDTVSLGWLGFLGLRALYTGIKKKTGKKTGCILLHAYFFYFHGNDWYIWTT